MDKYIITFSLLFLLGNSCFAQSLIGARLRSMGNNNAAVNDTWNFTGNFKENIEIYKPTIAAGYAKYFYGDDLSNQSLKFVMPLKKYEVGVNFLRYGISEYNEITTGISIAKNFGDQFSIGLRTNYHQLKIQNYGSTSGFSIDVGIMYHINNELTFGFNINNPSREAYINTKLLIKIPSIINVGAAYQASNKVLFAINLSRKFNETNDAGIGLDYQIIEFLSLRGGITIKPFKQYGGIGIDYKKFKLDLALESDPYLGYSSQIGFAYAF